MLRKLKQKYKDLKYRYKTTLLIVLAGMLPVVIIVTYMQTGTLKLLKEQETDSMQNSVNQAVDAMENQIQIYENLINYLSYSQDLRNVLSQTGESDYEKYIHYKEVVDPLLEMPQVYHKEIKGITIYSGNIDVAHGSSLVPMAELKSEEWAGQLEDSSILEWFVQRGAKKKIVAARKFYDNEDITAVLAMQLDYSELLEPFSSLLKDNVGGIIVDEDGKVIYSSYSMDDVYRPKSPESLDYLQKNYVCMDRNMEEMGWHFYLYRPESVITKSAYILMLRNIPIVLLCIVLLVVLGYAFSKRLVSCLERLTENMNQVHLGFRKVTVDSDSKDEVGTLIRSFRRMMEELNKLISEVYEAKIELQHTEMKALQAQINPHFLYNSLSIINWKAIEAGEDEISKVTLDLSTYYRTSLNRGETMTTVENEIRNIQAYLNIQLIMHDNSFRMEEEIDESCYQIQTPKLILQPLVENAIDHGLDPLEKEEKILTIRVKKEGDVVVFRVQDNGNGMPQEKAEQILGIQSPGYGVHNVYDRIKLLYKEKGSMRIISEEGVGTTVEIRIPEKPDEENRLQNKDGKVTM